MIVKSCRPASTLANVSWITEMCFSSLKVNYYVFLSNNCHADGHYTLTKQAYTYKMSKDTIILYFYVHCQQILWKKQNQ